MIDKNDVKMPVQRENMESMLGDKEQVRKIEDLLDMVSEVENKQELRLKSDYYSRFHWFGASAGKSDKSYFSYQEQAVYDFIFNLNKSGILSDQVGMGKTIEAGMIISELASRNELRSLLIIVPNEIMAQKWEYELANKFGIKPYRRTVNGVEEIYPDVKALRNFDDFCKCVFECLAEEKFVELYEHQFKHKYKAAPGAKDTLDGLIRGFINDDIREAVEMINRGLEANEIEGIEVVFDGKKYAIKGTSFEKAYTYDDGGEIARFLNGRQNQSMLENTINNAFFVKQYERLVKQELNGLYTLIGEYFTTVPEEISSIAESMSNRYPILVIPISYSENKGDKVVHHQFLNRTLLPEIKNYKHKYIIQDKNDHIDEIYENYRIIDFFIDVAYQTLIVDEVHDYIDVASKIDRNQFHKNQGYAKFPSKEYDRFELFDDYYFIKKSSLYKKLKTLSDKASRKIFLTATPIKSDMVDFYLLTLLASNKDADAYKRVSINLDQAYPLSEDREEAIANLYNTFKACVEYNAARNFCDRHSDFTRRERSDTGAEIGRFVYPYFNNSFLLTTTDERAVKDYLLSQISYMSMEEVVLELILSYNAEKNDSSSSDFDIKNVMKELCELLSYPDNEYRILSLQTRVVFRSLFNNSIKIRFEEDFTQNGKPIKRIRQLLELEDGARKWNKTYHRYGIRHTRHQTYNLSNCKELQKLSQNRIERYKNLPVWPKRDGKVIYLVRDDIFFDCLLDVKRPCEATKQSVIRMEDLPNFDRLIGSEAEKKERFESATAIFNYINDSMSGGVPGTHEPASSRYESVDLDDAGMVDYKLALVNKLMLGREKALGSISNKVLLFAENNRDEIVEWFKYQKCAPLYSGETLDDKKVQTYREKWRSYAVDTVGDEWHVSEDAEDLSRYDGNLLIIIDPKRYEKGVDLQKADTIINFDINYDPLKMEQRIGRIDRIRPTGKVPQINIVSFVPMNDMSGFVINFFANELKMFTQWMGETTGIVSVEEDGTSKKDGEDVSFEGKVYGLEAYYKYMYELCNRGVTDAEIEKMAADFSKKFGVDKNMAEIDFRFLKTVRGQFDAIFRNSISPQRAGYTVSNKPGTRLMRFNSSMGVFMPCSAADCKSCPNSKDCKAQGSGMRNQYSSFRRGVEEFFDNSIKYYQKETETFLKRLSDRVISGSDGEHIKNELNARTNLFKQKAKEIKALLPGVSSDAFVMPFADYLKIFNPIKELYWDTVVYKYLGLVIEQFHKQCDSVLKGARLFERFVKTLSIADFMKNMEGTV